MATKQNIIFTGSVIAIIACLLMFAKVNQRTPQKLQDEALPEISEVPVEYGIEAEGLKICYEKLDKDENLSEILTEHGVSYKQIHEIVQKSKGIFNHQAMRAGKPYCLFLDDSAHVAQVFIYENNKTDYTVIDLRNGIEVFQGKKEVQTLKRAATGIIASSLYQTIAENDLPIELAVEMADIFAWTIDFYRLQKGDRFRVIFEENWVEEDFAGIGKIQAVQFQNEGEDYFAIAFDQNGVEEYFDENGNSLRKSFLRSPLKFSRMTSGYSNRRFHPILKRYTSHLGIDYAAPRGTPIMAVADGVIMEARYKGGNGNYVKIRHHENIQTQYLHMSRFAKGIRPGTKVKQSDVIGYVGSTGLSTGPHVCFRFWKNGRQVNPLRQKMKPIKPVDPEFLDEYCEVRDLWMEKLIALHFTHPAQGAEESFQQ